MRNILLLFFLLCGSSRTLATACTVYDDARHRITLSHPAKRIISLAPDLTELLFAAGAGNKIVGVMRNSDYPAQAKKIPIVASFNQVDTEQIWALHPDLIVVWAACHLSEQFKKIGVPVYLSHQRKLTDIPKTLQRLGCLAGTEVTANLAAKQFLKRYHQLQKKYSKRKTLSVFYQVWPKPLMTVTAASWIDEAITLCAGKNVFADLRGVAPEVNVEAVLRKNPEVIIGSNSDAHWQSDWSSWSELFAVKNKALFSINADLLERAGPRILDGVQMMCQMINDARDAARINPKTLKMAKVQVK